MAGFDGTIETVRGRLSDARGEQLLRFWSGQGALDGAAARQRLPEVVCVLLDRAGEVAGASSVYPERVTLIGGRHFWVYRSLLLPHASTAGPAMIRTAFDALEGEFDPGSDDPIGLFIPVADPELMERRVEAVWPETQMMFAGWTADGRQARIRYFDEAAIGPGFPDSPTLEESRHLDTRLEDRYRIEPLRGSEAAAPGDVLAFWQREGAMPIEEAHRRIDEVLLVAIDWTDGVVGVSTAFLRHHPQLRMDLWHFRVFVAAAHRNGNLGVALALRGRDLLERRFTDGEDTRGRGMIFEVENEGLKTRFNKALWLPTEFTFIGENQRGDHVRVRYFPGATIPAPGLARAVD